MAAGQQRKRLASSNLHELQGKKKKRLDSSDYILNLRSHVHLQWDDAQKRVVAKREQVGITWKDMSPYVDSVPKFHSGLADVFSFPKEVFDLDNLMEVLSHKVWLTCLSVSERKLLMQFLPNCAFAEQAVQSLLTGENLHFGNPILKWSTLLCSSDLHPDILFQKQRKTRISKKQYNLEINKYHTNMVAALRMLKKKSETCEDPEKLKRKLSILNDTGDGVDAEMPNDYSIEKKELPTKMYNRYVDVTKYMSYIKVNKNQFKMLKELKHSGDHIQSKSIKRVLGDIKNFHIYPYESYDDEENKKLREHWMQVTKDTLAAYETCCKWKFLKMQQMECLEKELAESRTLIHDKKPLETGLFASSDVRQPVPIIDLEIEAIGKGAEQLLPSAFNVDTTSQMFGSYSQSHEEAIPTFPMASEMLSTSHMHGLSQPGLQFLINDGNLPETDRFSLLEDYQRHIKERHACEKELYMQNMIDKNFCAKIARDNLLGYHLSLSSRCTLQPSVTDGLGGKNWFPDEHQSQNVWSGTESSGNGVQSGGGGDGSLLRALPEFRDLSCRSSFDATSGSEQLMPARNYIDVSLVDSYITTQVSSSAGLTSAPIPSLDMIWMNYSHQNPSTLQESVRKPLMRHWHQ